MSAGAGIVYDSIPENDMETEAKAGAVIKLPKVWKIIKSSPVNMKILVIDTILSHTIWFNTLGSLAPRL